MWGHVEHVEQLGRGLCQHCLHQMPGGGGGGGSAGVSGLFMAGRVGGGGAAVVCLCAGAGELNAEKQRGEFEEQTAPLPIV